MSTSPMELVPQLGPVVCPEISEVEKQNVSSEAPVVRTEARNEQARQYRELQLQERVQRKEILEGRDALEYLRSLRSSQAPARAEKQIDVQSLEQELAHHIPRDTHLTRRARKLAWQIAKGRKLEQDWDYVFLSELTPEEQMLSDEDFLARYPSDPKPAAKRGGRPRKYKTLSAEKKGHAERQQRYRAKRQNTVAGVTKTPLQLIVN